MAVFLAPKWDAAQSHYVIETTEEFRGDHEDYLSVLRDSQGNTRFTDEDALHNLTDDMIDHLIEEGAANKWFSKLPSHEQLMKRTRHTFSRLATAEETAAVLTTVLMTPKQVTLVWTPFVAPVKSKEDAAAPQMYLEDSETEGEEDGVNEIVDSALPPVALKDSAQQTHEEYLLTRLRAAKARVEAEQIRMQYFEATGRMPPDSEDEDEDE
jgi:hypothetical protein